MLGKLEKIVLTYPKLIERIEGREDPEAERKKAIENLNEIKADFSSVTIKSFQKFLDATLPNLYDGININDNGVDFKKLVKENSVVLVPNHQSHADYMAINYIVYKTYKTPLYVAGGDNLNIFPIGKLFRKSGCFFIRRSFASDVLYKLTLEAYLYYLLMEGKPIEFFFEGGRSRTGKLLPPRFGLYQMLLEAHSHIPEEKKKKLMFLPTSIAHEYVPEQKALSKETKGGKKVKESAGQVFSLVKLFSYQFGNVNIRFSEPVEAKKVEGMEIKKTTQELAFRIHRRVAKNMAITPTSLLSMILLDEPSTAMRWSDILARAKSIILYASNYNIPFTKSLEEENLEKTLGRTIDILINNKKVETIGKNSHGQIFYSFREDVRSEMVYFKNTIIHHFLVPWIINMAWINLFNGTIFNLKDLKRFFLEQRRQLKHEFYLPTVKSFFVQAQKVISDIIGREVESLEDCLELSHVELYSVASALAPFSRTFYYINEAYYVSALTLRELYKSNPEGFKLDFYEKTFKEIFNLEKKTGRLVLFNESFSIPLFKNSIKFFQHEKILSNDVGSWSVKDAEKLEFFIAKMESELGELLKFNMRSEY